VVPLGASLTPHFSVDYHSESSKKMRSILVKIYGAQTHSAADFVGFPRQTKLGKAKSSDVAFSILFRFHP